ncbi:MAG: hypothetical protein WB607_12450 [Candidatus Acidiferrum sp.]
MQTKKAILMLAVLEVLAVVLAVLSFAQDTAAPSFTPGNSTSW